MRSMLVAVVLLAFMAITEAQQAKKIARIGFLSNTDAASDSPRAEGMRTALRELGYIEGQNIAFEYRYGEGKRERFPELADELVRLKVDVIVAAGGDPLIRAAMNATKTIPIVMYGGGTDPVEAGHIKSLAHPGGNVTGLTNIRVELTGKRLELFKEAVGKVTRFAVLYESASQTSVAELKELRTAAGALKLTISPWEVRVAEDFDKVFAGISKEHPDGLFVPANPLMSLNLKRIVGFTLKNRLPSMYTSRDFIEAGGLLYYGALREELSRQVAWYVDRILKGARPEDMPVQQPMRFEFAINLQTAKKIGVNIPQSVLFRATKVIK